MTLALLAAGIPAGKVVLAVVIAFAIGLAVGAQATSHEERAHNYNLEDVELDGLRKLEAAASAEGKRALSKLVAVYIRAKAKEHQAAQEIKKAL